MDIHVDKERIVSWVSRTSLIGKGEAMQVTEREVQGHTFELGI